MNRINPNKIIIAIVMGALFFTGLGIGYTRGCAIASKKVMRMMESKAKHDLVDIKALLDEERNDDAIEFIDAQLKELE
ncbi:hypothetical protein ACFL01_02850 [Planctomycetota bacterium]